MKNCLKLSAAFSAFVVSQVIPSSAHASILPPNNLHLQDRLFMEANISEQEFNTIVNEAVEMYKPLAAIHGAELKSNNLWTDSTVNASAQQDNNNKTWILNMYGGLARRPEVTPDGFAMVVCHELGHHFGGFPFYGNADWAASEGQSDYFATHACARKIWEAQPAENARFAAEISTQDKAKCDSASTKVEERNICYRSIAAGQSLANLLAALNSDGTPHTSTPDTREVGSTVTSHPKAQCRLDTYLAGSLCGVRFLDSIIPGRFQTEGQVSLQAEAVSAETSCMVATGWQFGVRPRCWYGPKLEFQAMKFGSMALADTAGNNNGYAEPGEKIELNFTLANGTTNLTSNVRGKLTSPTSGVTFTNDAASWPDLNPGASASANTSFGISLGSGLQCGSNIDLVLAANSAQGSTTIRKSIKLGNTVKSTLGNTTANTQIPDNNKTGIESIITTDAEGTASEASVSLAIEHPYPTDLQVYLKSPDGKLVKVYPAAGALVSVKKENLRAMPALSMAKKGIFQTFKVSLVNPVIKGDWTLKVVDGAARDAGTLESWGLEVSKSVCEPVQTLITKK